MNGKGHPYGVVGKISVSYIAADDRSRRIAVFILIGKYALHAFPCERGIDGGETFRIARHIAIAVMTHACPTAAHIGSVAKPAVVEIIQVLYRRFYLDIVQTLCIFFFHSGKFTRYGCIGRAEKFIPGESDAYDIMNGLTLACVECQRIFEYIAELLGIAVASGAAVSFAESRRVLLIAVRTDEGISSGVEACRLLGRGHISPYGTIALCIEGHKILAPNGIFLFVKAARCEIVSLRLIRIVDFCLCI